MADTTTEVRFTMYAVRLADGTFLQPAHSHIGGVSKTYGYARHYSTALAAAVGRKNAGIDGDVVAVDNDNEATMRVVSH